MMTKRTPPKKKLGAFMPDMYIQIDVKDIGEQYVKCNMYTGVLCVQMVISKTDYDELVRKNFFIRDGKTKDGSGALNTTETYTQ